MNNFVMSFIVTLVKSLMDNGLVDALQELVEAAMDWSIPGVEKRAKVLAELSKFGGVVGAAVAATAPFLINLALEALVAKVKMDNE